MIKVTNLENGFVSYHSIDSLEELKAILPAHTVYEVI